MKFAPPHKSSHQVAPEKLRCIWMTAGILSYQLCDCEFDCDNCPLDAAMRKHFGGTPEITDQKETPVVNLTAEDNFGDFFYSNNHCWIVRKDVQNVRVGLEPGFTSLLPPIKSVVLPSPNEKVTKDQSSFWIVVEGGTFSMSSPVTGSVVGRNTAIANDPSKLSRQPFPEGWLFDVQTEESELQVQGFMRKREADKEYFSDLERFNHLLISSLKRSNAGVGFTAADGGELIREAYKMFGPQRYFEMLKKIYGSG